MPELTLHEYTQEIERMVERGSYDEAIAHCRHILEQYPKYIEPYRLLGQAAFDRDDLQVATDMFTRILSANPSDFVARAGLAVVYDKEGSLKDAVWQMERAFEIEPGNAAIQEELRKLYGRRDGVVPDKVPLTRGALARLYMNGELYTEAIAELRAMLALEPQRVDLQALLVQALWRDEQRLEASEMALKVLDQMPYCLDANLILGEIWMNGGREEDAEVHLKRALALDPEGRRAAELFGRLAPIPCRPVEIERLEYVAPTAAPVIEEAPEWLSSMAAPAEAAAPAEEIPTWLQGIGLPEAAEAEAGAAPGLPAPEIAEEIPSWLTEMGVTAPPPTPVTPAVEIEEEAPEWLAQLREAAPAEAAPAIEEAEIPTWLKSLQPEAEAPAPEVAETEPDWLAQLRAEAGPLPTAEAEAAPEAAEIPDWMRALEPEAAEQPAAEEPEWLAQLHAELGTMPALEEAAPEAAMPTLEAAEVPDWLRALKPEGIEAAAPPEVEAPPIEEAPVAAAAEEMPPWAVEGAPMPSPEEALAFFQQITAGREAELQAQAQAEAEARMAELTGRKPEAVTPPAAPIEVTPPPPVAEAAAPAAEAPMLSPEEALAFFEKLTAGREAELRAQAEAEAAARMAEITGRKPAAVTPPAPVQAPPPVAQVAAPTPPVAEAPMPTPEEALAFFERLAAGKEEALRAQAEAEAAARMAEITGRPPAPPPTAVTPPEAVVEWPAPPVEEIEAAPAAPVAAEVAPPPVKIGTGPLGARQPVAATTGPDWWYQTIEDEEGPAEEAAPEVALAEAAVPLPEVMPEAAPAPVAPPREIPRVEPEAVAPPAPAPRAPKRLVRAKPAPAAPPKPVVDMDAIMARLRANPDDIQALLDLARGYRQLGDMNAARNGYNELVRRGAALEDVISDLETIIEDQPEDVDSTRLLGDAHMKAGNLQKALKLYRQALKKL